MKLATLDEIDYNGSLRGSVASVILIVFSFIHGLFANSALLQGILLFLAGCCMIFGFRARRRAKVKIDQDERTKTLGLLSSKYTLTILIVSLIVIFSISQFGFYTISVADTAVGLIALASIIKVISLFVLHAKK